jgi:hypothetical protein
MRHLRSISLLLPLVLAGVLAAPGQTESAKEVSFDKDVFPLIQKYCLPCHAAESYNPSDLSLDTYELMKKGGEHGAAVVPGKPEESLMIRKLGEAPPFGDRMPLARRRRSAEPPKRLSPEEVLLLSEWIRQGARKN